MRARVTSALLLVCAACAGDAEIPVPPLDDAEPLVRERIEAAVEAVRLAPQSPEAWGRLAEIYDVHRYVAQAISCYGRTRELDPDQWRWPYFAGLAHRDSDAAAARQELARAVELRADYAPAWFYLGLSELQAENLEDAEAHFRRALEVDAQLVNGLLGLARIALARGDRETAGRLADQAARTAPGEGAVHALRAQLLRLAGDVGRAAEAERLAAESPFPPSVLGFATLSDPVREELFLRRGVSSEWLRKRRESVKTPRARAALIDDLRRVVELEPGRHETLAMLGGLLVEHGAAEEGIAMLGEAARASPGDPQLRHDLAVALVRVEREGEALPVLRSLVADHPDHAPAWLLLGTLLALSGDLEESVSSLEQALSIRPQDVDARMELARSLWELRRYAEALEALSISSELRPRSAEIARELAWALATCPDGSLRDGPRARHIARQLCERSGFGNPMELDLLAAAMAETGDFAAADRQVARALQIVERTVAGLPPGDGTREVLEEFADEIRARQALYRRGKPYRQ